VNKVGWALLVATLAATVAMAGSADSSKEFVVVLPDEIEGARRVVLELSDVRLPKKAAVVFRARAIDEDGSEVPLGSVGMLAQSNDAEGTLLHPTVRIDVTKALKRWQQHHLGVSAVRIRVVPYAGAEAMVNLEWSVESADLVLIR
jgi:hypothetical protein